MIQWQMYVSLAEEKHKGHRLRIGKRRAMSKRNVRNVNEYLFYTQHSNTSLLPLFYKTRISNLLLLRG